MNDEALSENVEADASVSKDEKDLSQKDVSDDIIIEEDISADSFGVSLEQSNINLTYTLDDNGTLTISGTGEMDNYDLYFPVPWYSYRSQIETVIIETGVTSIGENAFESCVSLTSVTIPDSVTSIGEDAFSGCVSLTSVTIPDSVTSIGSHAFYNCTNLTSVTIPDSVTSISGDAFRDTALYNDSSNWENGVLYIGNYLIDTKADTIHTSYTIKSGTKAIAGGAFYDCTGLTSVTIPDSVTSIGGSAFYNTAIYNDSSNWKLGVLYIGNYLIDANEDTIRTLCTIKSGTKVIADRAFSGCTSLTSVTIPDSLTSIGGSAFYNCIGLTSVTIPNSVTSIEWGAFYNCTSLTSVTIPDSVTSIGGKSFYNCDGLTSITIPDSVKTIGEQAFDYCDNLKSITIGKGVTSIGDLAFGYDDAGTIDGFTVIGYVGSVAETYAKENDLIFVAINSTKLPETESDVYMDAEAKTMPNVVERTTAGTIISNLSAYGITATITDKDGNNIESTAIVGTGCKVTDQNGNTYTIIVKGDTDGSGEIDATDYIRIKSLFLEQITLEEAYLLASDTDGTKEIDSTDYIRVKSYFLGTFEF